jgi:hypothetical protein
MQKPNFDPINKFAFRNRVQNNFSSAYLTMISIIEGVTFGFIMANTFSTFKVDLPLEFLVYPLMSFATLILTFYFYSYFVSAVYTLPNFRESVIPFCLAATQVIPTFFFNQPKYWWFLFALFCIVSILAFHNTLRSLHPGMYAADFQLGYQKSRMEIVSNICFTIVGLLVAVAAGAVYPNTKIDSSTSLRTYDYVPILAITALIVAMIFKSQKYYLAAIFKEAGLLVEVTFPVSENTIGQQGERAEGHDSDEQGSSGTSLPAQ